MYVEVVFTVGSSTETVLLWFSSTKNNEAIESCVQALASVYKDTFELVDSDTEVSAVWGRRSATEARQLINAGLEVQDADIL